MFKISGHSFVHRAYTFAFGNCFNMAKMSIDLGILLLIGVTTVFLKESSTLGTEVGQGAQFISSPAHMVDSNSLLGHHEESMHLASKGSQPRKRSKRCTCYSYKDKECVYYCHLDIIWINTPERTVPYGLSSYRGSQRIRRSSEDMVYGLTGFASQRCVCADRSDPQCSDFCKARSQVTVTDRAPKG